MIRMVLCGATGRMGRAIKKLVSEEEAFAISHEVAPSLRTTFWSFNGEADVTLDFSTPAVLSEALSFCVTRKLPLVIGTTGHSEDVYGELEEAARHIAIIKSENFSRGAYVLGSLAKRAVQMLGDDYDVSIVESHHRNKVDAPSGTAKRIAAMMGVPVQTHSIRGGGLTGTHEIFFDGANDRIVLSHEALDRRLFAIGALDAAKWILQCAPGLYGMEDFERRTEDSAQGFKYSHR